MVGGCSGAGFEFIGMDAAVNIAQLAAIGFSPSLLRIQNHPSGRHASAYR